LNIGVLFHNDQPHGGDPMHGAGKCNPCSLVRLSERRHQTVAEFLDTLPEQFGGRKEIT